MFLRRLVLGLGIVLAHQPPLAAAADIEFVTQELPWAVAEKPYAVPPLQVRSSGGCPLGGVSYNVVSGILPPGLQLSKLGYFAGTPLRTGSWEFAVRVSNGCTWTARHYVIVVTGAPILTVTPLKIEFSGTQPMERSVQVSSTWPKLAYRVESSDAWLIAAPDRGFTPRQGSGVDSDTVRLRIDTGLLKPGRHSGKLTFGAWQASNQPVVTIEVTIPESRSGSPPARPIKSEETAPQRNP